MNTTISKKTIITHRQKHTHTQRDTHKQALYSSTTAIKTGSRLMKPQTLDVRSNRKTRYSIVYDMIHYSYVRQNAEK